MLSLNNVTCEFNIYSSLKGLSFSIEKGDNAVIFGTENSGIDGLCSLLTGMHPYSGDILHDGVQILSMNERAKNNLRKKIVYMQRNFGLISNMTVEENIALPLHYHSDMTINEIDAKVDIIIHELHLEYCRDMRPINVKPSEALKTAYARSISLNPDILLVEHPLEGQCPLNAVTFLKHLKKRCMEKDKSVIIITYDPMQFSEFADRFIMLDYGKIVFDGGRELMQNPVDGFVRQYLDFTEGPMEIW